MDTNSQIGSNLRPGYAEEVKDRLAADYAEFAERTRELLTASESLPITVEDSDAVAMVAAAVVQLRDRRTEVIALHRDEKQPFLRGGEAVDAFFFEMRDGLEKVRRELQARLDAYKQKQAAEERRRREEEARRAREAAAKAEAERREAERRKVEAEAAARRARKPETVEARLEAANEAASDADSAFVQAALAKSQADQLELDAQASPASMVRERFIEPGASGQVTMRKQAFVLITDFDKVDLERLRPYFKPEHIEYALRAWARATGYQETMPGAIAEMRDTTVVR